MNLKELKTINARIAKLNSNMSFWRAELYRTSSKLKDTNEQHRNSPDKMAEYTAKIIYEEAKLQRYVAVKERALKRLIKNASDSETYDATAVYLRAVECCSWAKISKKTGCVYSADYIRLRCGKYHW